jgi:hypothetical protein
MPTSKSKHTLEYNPAKRCSINKDKNTVKINSMINDSIRNPKALESDINIIYKGLIKSPKKGKINNSLKGLTSIIITEGAIKCNPYMTNKKRSKTFHKSLKYPIIPLPESFNIFSQIYE